MLKVNFRNFRCFIITILTYAGTAKGTLFAIVHDEDNGVPCAADLTTGDENPGLCC